jgi:hypothetical protein
MSRIEGENMADERADKAQTQKRMALEDAVWQALEAGLDRRDVEDTVGSAIDDYEADS